MREGGTWGHPGDSRGVYLPPAKMTRAVGQRAVDRATAHEAPWAGAAVAHGSAGGRNYSGPGMGWRNLVLPLSFAGHALVELGGCPGRGVVRQLIEIERGFIQ